MPTATAVDPTEASALVAGALEAILSANLDALGGRIASPHAQGKRRLPLHLSQVAADDVQANAAGAVAETVADSDGHGDAGAASTSDADADAYRDAYSDADANTDGKPDSDADVEASAASLAADATAAAAADAESSAAAAGIAQTAAHLADVAASAAAAAKSVLPWPSDTPTWHKPLSGRVWRSGFGECNARRKAPSAASSHQSESRVLALYVDHEGVCHAPGGHAPVGRDALFQILRYEMRGKLPVKTESDSAKRLTKSVSFALEDVIVAFREGRDLLWAQLEGEG